MAEKEPRISVVGVKDGTVGQSTAAGIVYGGMHNTTNNSQGDRTIHNSGTIGNVSTGNGHGGHMSTAMGSEARKKALEDITEDDIIAILKEKKLGRYEKKFREWGIDGFLFHKLTEERLCKFGVADDWDRERPLNLKKHQPK